MAMTNEELFEDLKQFIEVTLSQRTAELATKEDVRRIDAKLDTIHSAVAETAEDHEHRIHRLEQRTA